MYMKHAINDKYNKLVEIKTLNPKYLPFTILLVFIGIPFESGLTSALNNQGFLSTVVDIFTGSSYYVFLAIFIPMLIVFVLLQRLYIKKKYGFLVDENLSQFEKNQMYSDIYMKQYNKIVNSKVFSNKERNDRLIQTKLNRDEMIVKKQILDLLKKHDSLD